MNAVDLYYQKKKESKFGDNDCLEIAFLFRWFYNHSLPSPIHVHVYHSAEYLMICE
jgi:hypothetical protein